MKHRLLIVLSFILVIAIVNINIVLAAPNIGGISDFTMGFNDYELIELGDYGDDFINESIAVYYYDPDTSDYTEILMVDEPIIDDNTYWTFTLVADDQLRISTKEKEIYSYDINICVGDNVGEWDDCTDFDFTIEEQTNVWDEQNFSNVTLFGYESTQLSMDQYFDQYSYIQVAFNDNGGNSVILARDLYDDELWYDNHIRVGLIPSVSDMHLVIQGQEEYFYHQFIVQAITINGTRTKYFYVNTTTSSLDFIGENSKSRQKVQVGDGNGGAGLFGYVYEGYEGYFTQFGIGLTDYDADFCVPCAVKITIEQPQYTVLASKSFMVQCDTTQTTIADFGYGDYTNLITDDLVYYSFNYGVGSCNNMKFYGGVTANNNTYADLMNGWFGGSVDDATRIGWNFTAVQFLNGSNYPSKHRSINDIKIYKGESEEIDFTDYFLNYDRVQVQFLDENTYVLLETNLSDGTDTYDGNIYASITNRDEDSIVLTISDAGQDWNGQFQIYIKNENGGILEIMEVE